AVFQCAERLVALTAVGVIVPSVRARRRVEGCQPHAVRPQIGDVVQTAGDARDVDDADTFAVGEATRVDLVQDCVTPPLLHAFPLGSVQLTRTIRGSPSEPRWNGGG